MEDALSCLRAYMVAGSEKGTVTYLPKTHGLTYDEMASLPQAAVLVCLFERTDGEVPSRPDVFFPRFVVSF